MNNKDNVCRNVNGCGLNHSEPCNAIECEYVEMQPHFHHLDLPTGIKNEETI